MTFMRQAGFEPYYGRCIVADMAATGLVDVRGEGRARVIDSSSPGFDFFRLSFDLTSADRGHTDRWISALTSANVE